jgi:dipeptidyl aminopeptidase/acylaminoacyl peptidase
VNRIALTISLICVALSSLSNVSLVQAERMTPERLWDLKRIGDAAVSPDGKQLAYLVTQYDLGENSGTTSLMIQTLPTSIGVGTSPSLAIGFGTQLAVSSARSLLKDVKGLQSLSWIKRPEGDYLLYIAPTAGEESQPQAWILDSKGGTPRQLTHVSQGISNLKASPGGEAIAFTADVKMDRTVNELYEDLPKADARIIDSLLYRHWNQWHDFAYSHVHVAKFDAQGNLAEPVDIMKSLRADCPVPPFGGAEQFNFSPDGQQLSLTLKLVNNPAESTDTNIYLVDLAEGVLRNITPGMPGYDMEPRYAPDGRTLAFHSMLRAGFEADRNRIMLYDRAGGTMRETTSGLDQTVHNAVWSSDGKRMYFASEVRGTTQVYEIEIETSSLRQISSGRFDFSVISPVVGTSLVLVGQQNMLRPTELALLDSQTGQLATITDVNG